VRVVASDLDHTLTWTDGVLPPRTIGALEAARDAGLNVIVATGRMVQSLRRVLEPVGLHDPVVCYQGAAVVSADDEWLLHVPIEVGIAREVIAAAEAEGYHPNVYVDDELYVSEITPGSRAYADFQQIPIHPVGDVKAWLPSPPTKIVCVGDPVELDAVGERLRARFGHRLWVTKSLPKFLEFATSGVSKGSGLQFLAERMGFDREQTIAFGDGENDVELVEWAGFGVAVANAHERVKAAADWICPSAAEEGVAQVLEALLDSGG
jgi:Cof subfamily protein (haloacid dehalogenase superfamily)